MSGGITLNEVEALVWQLPPQEQLKLLAHVAERLSEENVSENSSKRATDDSVADGLAWLRACDAIAGQTPGTFDSAKDLREIREERIEDIERSMSGRKRSREARS